MAKEIKIPKIGTNEDVVTIAQICVKNGEHVAKGQLVAVFETTKATEDCIAEESGYIYVNVCEGEEVAVGTIFATICETPDEIMTDAIAAISEHKESCIEQLISDKALKLIEQYKIDINLFPKNKVIREKDVLKFLDNSENMEQDKSNAIIIVCGGSVAKMCIDAITLMSGYRFGGITDIYAQKDSEIMGVPVIGDIDVLEEKYMQGHRSAVNAFGGLVNSNTDPLFFEREKLYHRIKKMNYFMPNIIHPKANIEPSASFGDANLIFSGAYVGSEAVIGNDCIINTGAVVSHDCKIGDHCRISPGAILAGNVAVGANTIIGMGVTVYIGCKIGKNVIIYNGKHIFNDVPDNTIVK